MLRRLSLSFILIFLPLVALSGVIKEGTLSASSDGNNILIRWLSEVEIGVQRFELERQAGTSGPFFLLVQVDPKGNNSAYDYVDESAFRVTENIYRYRVKIVFSNGNPPEYVGPITVSHNPSSVGRTWGSIKAMFR